MAKVNHWKFEEASGAGSFILDSTGSTDLALQYSSDAIHINGVLGNAWYFNSELTWLYNADLDSVLTGSGDFTISLWVFVDETPGADIDRYMLYIGEWGVSTSVKLTVEYDIGIVSFSVSTDGSAWTDVVDTGIFAIDDMMWHHVAITKSSTTYSIYVDGVFVDSATGPSAIWGGSGEGYLARGSSADNPPKMALDNVEIFDSALTAAEILDIVYYVSPPPTFSSEVVKYQSGYRWLVELESGATTLRYSSFDMPLLSDGMCEGRVMSVGAVERKLSFKSDNAGPSITLFDPDGSIEAYGITRGWTVRFKAGFDTLEFASWMTVATYEVAYKPDRNHRTIRIQCVSKSISTLGLMTSFPKIESDDSYLYGTLSVQTERVGEQLPMYFGIHESATGAVPLVYLGFDLVTPGLVYLVNASDPDADATIIGQIFVDGKEVISYTGATITTGNYQYKVVRFSIDEAASYGLIDDRTSRAMSRYRPWEPRQPDLIRGMDGTIRKPKRQELFADSRPVRKLTANIDGRYNDPISLFEHVLTYHGGGVDLRDSTSYADAQSRLDKIPAAISVAIERAAFIEELFNKVCEDYQISQYWTTTGLHALYYPMDSTAAQSQASFASEVSLGDLNDYIGEAQFISNTAGGKAPVNAVQIETLAGKETISDTDAVSAYGTVGMNLAQDTICCNSARRAMAWSIIQRNKTPRVSANVTMSVAGLSRELGDIVRSTIRSAPEQGGWTNKLGTVEAISWEPNAAKVKLLLSDRSVFEDPLVGYMDTEDNWLVLEITDANFSSGGSSFTSTDANLSTVVAGNMIFYNGSDDGNCSRITRVSEAAGTYTISVGKTFDVTSTGATIQIFDTAQNGSYAQAGGVDGLMVNQNIADYMKPRGDVQVSYMLWENSAVAPDSGGNKNVAMTSVGSVSYTSAGQIGATPVFNGSDAYFSSGAAISPVPTSYVISAWVKPDADFATSGAVVARTIPSDGTSTTNTNVELVVTAAGAVNIKWEHSANVEVSKTTASGVISFGEWNFIAAQIDGSGNLDIYTGSNDASALTTQLASTGLTNPTGGDSGVITIANSARTTMLFKGSIQAVQQYVAVTSAGTVPNLFTNSKRQAANKVV